MGQAPVQGVAGSASYNPAFSVIATRAFRSLGVIDETETPDADQMQDALTCAQMWLKALEATGIHVWTQEEAILFLQAGQARYILADPSASITPDNAAAAYSWVTNTLASNAVGGASTLALNTALGSFTAGMNVGVGLDAGPTQWTTTAAGQSGSNLGIATPLLSQASAGANVFGYQPANAITRPLQVPQARRLQFQGMIETPMICMARKDYEELPQKTNPGIPTQFFYAPKQGYGEMFVWPVPLDASSAIRFTWLRPIADLLTQASAPDLPQEWALPLTWCMAEELGLSYSVPAARWDRVLLKAREMRDLVLSWDRDSQDVQFGFDVYGMGR